MVEEHRAAFRVAILASIAASLIIVFLTGVLIAIGWGGSLGPPMSSPEKALSVLIFGLVCLLPVTSVAIGLSARNARPLPRWALVLALLAGGASVCLGLLSLLTDPGDFLWSGAPMLLFAAASFASVKFYPKGAN